MGELLHWLHACKGWIDREIDDNGIEWIGLRCNTCGKFCNPTLSRVQTTEAGRRALSGEENG